MIRREVIALERTRNTSQKELITKKIPENMRWIRTLQLYNCWRQNRGYVPGNVELLVTNRCNSRCVMCNIWKLPKKNLEVIRDELSTTEIKILLKELSKMGAKALCLSGGEPTLRGDLIEIIKTAKKEGFSVEMITNGTVIDRRLANQLIECSVDRIVFSIDSPTPNAHDKIRGVSGGWEKATKGIELLNDEKRKAVTRKTHIAIHYIVARVNYQLINEMINLKSQLNYDSIKFIPIIQKAPRAEKFLLRYEDIDMLQSSIPTLKKRLQYNNLPLSTIAPLVELCRRKEDTVEGKYADSINKKILCFEPWSMTTIDPFGNVYPCCYACTFQNLSEDLTSNFWGSKDYSMGNVRNSSFKKIWNGEKYNHFRALCKKPPSFPMCRWCNYRAFGSVVLTGLFKDRKLLLRILAKRFQNFIINKNFSINDISMF